MLAGVEKAFFAVLHELYIAFSWPFIPHSALPGISLRPLTFNKVYFLCNCTHMRYGMNACFVRRCVYFYASVYCMHACMCVNECDEHRVPIQTAN